MALVVKDSSAMKNDDVGDSKDGKPKALEAVQTTSERYARFYVLVAGILFFFGCHNYMQELIMSQPGFKVSRFQLSLDRFVSLCIPLEAYVALRRSVLLCQFASIFHSLQNLLSLLKLLSVPRFVSHSINATLSILQ
jgi:hypothetical protein